MKSYLRFLNRNRLYTAIMAVGMSVSLAFVIIMSCFLWQNICVNHRYPDQDRMYAVGLKGSLHSNLVMVQTMADAIPEIETGTSIIERPVDLLEINGEVTDCRSFIGVDRYFFEMFPADFIAGDASVLENSDNVIITESLANAFGGTEITGRKITLAEGMELTVAAVTEDFDETIFKNVQLIVSLGHSTFERSRNSALGTAGNNVVSIIRIKEGTDEAELLMKMDRVYEEHIPENYRRDSYLCITGLDEVYTSETNDGWSLFKKGNQDLMKAFSVIVVFLLISSIFNYINLSTALAGKRSRETATRMLLGEGRGKVFTRNMCESIGFMAVCMTIAFILAHIGLPAVNTLINSPIPIRMKFSQGYIYTYLVILSITALVCGLVPAFLSMRSRPMELLKGHIGNGGKKTFSRFFIILQNAIAIVVAAVALTMEFQIRYMMDMPLNAETEGVYICRTFSSGFDNTLRKLPYVEAIGRADGHPGQYCGSYGFPLREDIGNPVTMHTFNCDSTAFAIFGLKTVRCYGKQMARGAWLTESAVKKLEIDPENPVFPQENSWVINQENIAGIIRDIPFSSAINLNVDAVGAVILGLQDARSDYILKLSDASEENIRELDRLCLEEVKKTMGPNAPMMSGYFPELIGKEYEDMRKQVRLIEIFMVIAIMLSALGQIAMSTYFATGRQKEIGIRKVFGGTVRSESIRNISEYALYSIIAAAPTVPVSVYIAGRYLEGFAYRMPQTADIYIYAVLIIFAVSLLAVLWQVLRAARTNPADALKKE